MSEILNQNFDTQVTKHEISNQSPEDFANQIKVWRENANKAELNDPDGKYDEKKLSSMFDEQFSSLSYNPSHREAWRKDIFEKVKKALSSDPAKNIADSYEKRGLWDWDREKQISWVFKWEKPIKTASI